MKERIGYSDLPDHLVTPKLPIFVQGLIVKLARLDDGVSFPYSAHLTKQVSSIVDDGSFAGRNHSIYDSLHDAINIRTSRKEKVESVEMCYVV